MSLTVTRSCLPLRVLAVATFLLTVSGCVDLDDAAGLSTLSEEARVALPRVSNDVAGTCARQNILFENTPQAERVQAQQAQDCKPYEGIAAQLAKDEGVLTDYFDALGRLASNKPLSYDAAIDQNVTATSTITGLSASTVAAGNDAQSLLKALADAATLGYRKKQLGQLIKANDPAIQSLTQALKKVIAVDYGLLLSNEEQSLDTFYKGPMAAAQPNERLALILVQRQYAHDRTALQSRKDAIGSYGKIMDELGALHSKLKLEADKKASMVEIGKEVRPIIESLKDVITDLKARSN